MADTPTLANCAGVTADQAGCAADALLPVSPFYALNYHFGMLLGVEDFDTEQAYHRGKSRLHNAWLHGEGVLWGLAVVVDPEHDEIRVTRGLALDPAGRELHLDEDLCLSLPAWLAALPEQERVRLAGADGTTPFEAHCTIRHRACLSRQVPALMEPCDGSGRDTAYSRVFETVEIRLLPGLAPAPPVPPYHRVRLLLGLAAARTEDADGKPAAQEDAAILKARDDLLAKPRPERLALALERLRDCAAWDTAELTPPKTAAGEDWLLFPGPDAAGLVLANLEGLTLTRSGDTLHLKSGTPNYAPRPSHLATRTIQELAAAAFFCCTPPAPASAPEAATTPVETDAAATPGGPQADPRQVLFDGQQVRLQVTADLHPDSVKPAAFTVSGFTAGFGWKVHKVSDALFEPSDRSVTLWLSTKVTGDLLRLVARGTGPTPLLGADLEPFAGAVGDPPAPAGRDFVHMQKGS